MPYEPPIPVHPMSDEDRMYLRLIYGKAARKSEDPATWTGALVVDLDRILGWGVNRFPPGTILTPELLADKEWKKNNIIHAETDSYDQTIEQGYSLEGKDVRGNWITCDPCAGRTREERVRRYIGHWDCIQRSPERWWPSLNDGLNTLIKAGVEVYAVQGKVGGIEHKFNGELWLP